LWNCWHCHYFGLFSFAKLEKTSPKMIKAKLVFLVPAFDFGCLNYWILWVVKVFVNQMTPLKTILSQERIKKALIFNSWLPAFKEKITLSYVVGLQNWKASKHLNHH
jgi:hypothetical protein